METFKNTYKQLVPSLAGSSREHNQHLEEMATDV